MYIYSCGVGKSSHCTWRRDGLGFCLNNGCKKYPISSENGKEQILRKSYFKIVDSDKKVPFQKEAFWMIDEKDQPIKIQAQYLILIHYISFVDYDTNTNKPHITQIKQF